MESVLNHVDKISKYIFVYNFDDVDLKDEKIITTLKTTIIHFKSLSQTMNRNDLKNDN